jgi:hypothetical protein
MHLRARAPAEHPFHKYSRERTPVVRLGGQDAHAPFEAFIPQPFDQLLYKLHLHFAVHLCAQQGTHGKGLINPMCSGQSGPTTNTRVRTRCLSCSGSILGSCGATAAPTHTQTHSQWQVGGTHEPSAAAARLADDRQRGLGVARSRARGGACCGINGGPSRAFGCPPCTVYTRLGSATTPAERSAAGAERTAVSTHRPRGRRPR